MNSANTVFAVVVHTGKYTSRFAFETREAAEKFAYLNWSPLVCGPGSYEWAEVVAG